MKVDMARQLVDGGLQAHWITLLWSSRSVMSSMLVALVTLRIPTALSGSRYELPRFA